MSIKLEEMMNEFRYPTQITTDKAVTINNSLTVTGTATLSGVNTLTTGAAGDFTVNGTLTATGNVTVKGTLDVTGAARLGVVTVTGASVFTSTITATGTSGSIYLGAGGPTISIVNFTGAANLPDITAVTGSIAINLGGTGPASRIFIAKGGGSAWTNLVAGA